MGKSLIIVESPAKAKTIGKFLQNKFIIKASNGHIRDLPKKSFGVDPKDDFKAMTDINIREVAIFAPLIVLIFWMGIYPSSFINPMAPALEKVITRYNDANAISIPQGVYP